MPSSCIQLCHSELCTRTHIQHTSSKYKQETIPASTSSFYFKAEHNNSKSVMLCNGYIIGDLIYHAQLFLCSLSTCQSNYLIMPGQLSKMTQGKPLEHQLSHFTSNLQRITSRTLLKVVQKAVTAHTAGFAA